MARTSVQRPLTWLGALPGIVFLSWIAVPLWPTSGFGQTPLPSQAPTPEIAQDVSSKQHDPLTILALDLLETLDARLQQSPPERAQAWREYLQLPALAARLAKPHGWSRQDRELIDLALERLARSDASLQVTPLPQLRATLERIRTERLGPSYGELAEAVERAEFTFYPPGQVAVAREDLVNALRRLDRFLSADPTAATAWRDYLRWDQWAGPLLAEPHLTGSPEAERPERVTVEQLGLALRRLSAGYAGLDRTEFAAVRQALEQYQQRLALSDTPESQAAAEQHRHALAAALRQLSVKGQAFSAEATTTGEASPSSPAIAGESEAAATASRELFWLEQTGSQPALVSQLREVLLRPNFLARFSARLIEQDLQHAVDEVRAVRENILGTQVRGTGRTRGVVQARLLPDPGQANFELSFRGQIDSDTVGYNGPVLIYSEGTTDFTGTKRLAFSAQGLSAADAQFQSSTAARTKGLATTAPRIIEALVCRIASRKVQEQRGASDRIANERARLRLTSGFDSQVQDAVSRGNESLAGRIRPRLIASGIFPQKFSLLTTRRHVYISFAQTVDGRLAAWGEPPALVSASDAQLRMHQSSINNFATGLLAGRRLTQEEAAGDAVALLGNVPEGLEPGEEQRSWSITFAQEKPIELTVANGDLQIVVRGASYTSGDRQFGAMNVSAAYRLQQGPKDFRLVRSEELGIFPPGFDHAGGQRFGVREQVLRRMLQRRFEKIFQAEFLITDPIEVRRRTQTEPLRLDVQEVYLNDGWLGIDLGVVE